MNYAWKCKWCGHRTEAPERPDCPPSPLTWFSHGPMVRDYGSVYMKVSPFEAHFNHATGTVVKSAREHADDLKRISERNESATGIPSNMEPVDYRDRDALGVSPDDDIVQRIEKANVDSGRQSLTTKTFS